MANNSLVTVIIPCFQQSRFLEQALDSLVQQINKNWECIIIDDGSTDNTSRIGKKWADKDARFKYYYQKNRGVSAARNLGLSKSKGEYVQFLDADDYLMPNKLSSGYEVLNKDADIDLVISNFRMFKNDPARTLPPFCKLRQEFFNFQSILYDWSCTFSIPVHCGFFRKNVFNELIFPENLSAQEDWLVWTEIFRREKKVFYIDEPMALYRIHPASRMYSKGIIDDQMRAFQILKKKLTDDQYLRFSETMTERYLNRSEALKRELILLRGKNYVTFGNFLRRILAKFGLREWAKKHLP